MLQGMMQTQVFQASLSQRRWPGLRLSRMLPAVRYSSSSPASLSVSPRSRTVINISPAMASWVLGSQRALIALHMGHIDSLRMWRGDRGDPWSRRSTFLWPSTSGERVTPELPPLGRITVGGQSGARTVMSTAEPELRSAQPWHQSLVLSKGHPMLPYHRISQTRLALDVPISLTRIPALLAT